MNVYLKSILFGLMVAMSCSMYGQGSVGIGTEMPDASALLDLVATNKGVLVPRLTSAQRSGIIAPANGLLVYDSDTKSFWYFDSTLTIWTELRSGIIKSLVDADGDTKIQVEKNADEDVIRFDLAGTEKMVLTQNAHGWERLEFGSGSPAVGTGALYSNTTGFNNTANGSYALYSNTSGYNNIANGFRSLQANLTGTDNIASGYFALGQNKTGNLNIAIGSLALGSNLSGNGNAAIGYNALAQNSTGNSNLAIGGVSLGQNSTGSYNIAIGSSSLHHNRANSRSTAIGYAAMYNADNTSTGDSTYNTAVGAEALRGSGTPSSNTGKYNTALGDAALYSNTSGSRNVATGLQALYSNSTGSGNIAIGNSALHSNTTQSGLVAIGDSSLYSNTGGFYNTAIGYKSLNSNTTGNANTANGYQSLYNNTAGSSNTANGYSALYYNTTGDGNTANGYYSLYSNTTGHSNTANGNFALSSNTTGNSNTALGYESLYSNRANNRTTAIGYQAMRNSDNNFFGELKTYNTAVGAEALKGFLYPAYNTGKYNTAIGDAAMYSTASGSNNSALGVYALYKNFYGSNNVAIGDSSLYLNFMSGNTAIGSKALINNTSGTNNTAIGYNADVTSGNLSNATSIGFNAKVSSSNSMILGGTGTEAVRVGIGTATPANSAALDVTSTSKGFLPPRMTKDQMEAIPAPAEGLTVYCTNCKYKGIFFYSGAVWVGMSDNLPHDISPTDVYNPATGKVWMDRNLGASRVALNYADELAYGDLYQWGRATDGHQLRTSGTTNILSGTDTPGHDDFILAPSAPNNWRSPQNNSLWQGVSGINNPCPSGYRLPSSEEFNEELLSWSELTSEGAFNSHLKLPLGGLRNYIGSFGYYSTSGIYWTSSNNSFAPQQSKYVGFDNVEAGIGTTYRALGASVRCIKDSGTLGAIENLNCSNALIIGSLVENSPANGESAVLGYTGGNGLFHNGQIVSSTGVSGLTATLSAGNFLVGSGTLTYLITGTPASSGNANFALNIGGTSCSLIIPVEADVYPPGTVHCNPNNHTLVVEVLNPITGEIWMDRNLGASRVATSSTDALAYGDLYQWGRRADGHQCRTSATTSILSGTNTPNHDDFILAPDPPYDWRSPQNDNLWQGISGINNPCPEGFRIPTEAELNAEKASWGSNDAAGAFASPLKFTLAGQRSDSNGSINDEGTFGRYWSSNIDGTRSRNLYFGSTFAFLFSDNRAYGYCIRCIKE